MQSTAPIECDALVIGAGPVGLFQVFQLGLLEISCHVVDALPFAGGQCVQLYADKPIYDIPGTPVTTGGGLVESLLRQVEPFSPEFHLGGQVATMARQPDGRLLMGTSRGTQFLAGLRELKLRQATRLLGRRCRPSVDHRPAERQREPPRRAAKRAGPRAMPANEAVA